MKKYLIVAVVLIVIALLFPSLIYKALPSKKINNGVGKEFVIRSGETVEFGKDKYVTHCGYSGNGMTSDFYPMFSWKIKGIIYPCSESSFGYTGFDKSPCNNWGGPCGPYRPYDMEYVFTASKKPLKVTIFETRDLYNKWTYEYCASNVVQCGLYNPNNCKVQKVISESECTNEYVENFRAECKVRPETRNGDSGTSTSGVENQDNCLKDQIINNHLSSENCTLVIEDEMKKKECLDVRQKEENLFKELYVD